MRPIPAPRYPDAPPMPGGNSRDWVVHPGPEQSPRFTLAPCHARKATLRLPAGKTLLDAVADAVMAQGADGACVILDGVPLSVVNYVMPDGPVDEDHAAWYSETHHDEDVRLDKATASVGKRDGEWFLHTHAMWAGDAPAMGHLLNDQCTMAEDCEVEAWLLSGAWLGVAPDPETNFPLFRPERGKAAGEVQAALLTIRPHGDLRGTIEAACSELGFENASIHGIGSLIGAAFSDAPPMAAPLSEVLLLEGCAVRGGRCRQLPLACVDPAGAIFRGDLKAGDGPVCVTFELLVLSECRADRAGG